jgi:hypothetical protein
MNNYNTNNYDIYYPKINLSKIKNPLILELYRTTLYSKLQDKVKEERLKYNTNTSDKNKSLSEVFALDMMSILLFNHKFKSKFDPLFDSTSPFTKINIDNYFFKYKCLKTLSQETIEIILKVFPKISNTYIKYYKQIVENLKLINNIKFNISYSTELINNKEFINISLEILNDKLDIKYNKNLKISSDIFNHLFKLYKITNNVDKINNELLENVYILYNRYTTFSSGNNQSSILPSFKQLLKDKLNIKIELFGSPLNTKLIKFGSFFYDIDHKFGSIGNYFDTKILKGYYELNPVFDSCIIDRMFDKALTEFKEANKTKQPLLYCFIIPKTYFKYKSLHSDYDLFIKYNLLLKKEDFPYRRYKRTFDFVVTTPIIDTHIIICCTDYINNYVTYNVSIFKSLLNEWMGNHLIKH